MQRKYSEQVRHFVNKVVTAPYQDVYGRDCIPILKDSQLLSINCPGFSRIYIPIVSRKYYDVIPQKQIYRNFFGMMRSTLGQYRPHILCEVWHGRGCRTLYVVGNNFLFDRSRQKLVYVIGCGESGPLIYVDGEVWRDGDSSDYKYLRTKLILPALDFMDGKVSLVITDTEPFWKVSRFFSATESKSMLWKKLREEYNGEQKDKECDKQGGGGHQV